MFSTHGGILGSFLEKKMLISFSLRPDHYLLTFLCELLVQLQLSSVVAAVELSNCLPFLVE